MAESPEPAVAVGSGLNDPRGFAHKPGRAPVEGIVEETSSQNAVTMEKLSILLIFLAVVWDSAVTAAEKPLVLDVWPGSAGREGRHRPGEIPATAAGGEARQAADQRNTADDHRLSA